MFSFCFKKCFDSKIFPNRPLLKLHAIFWSLCLTSSHRMPYKPAICFSTADRRTSTHSVFCDFCREPCQHATRGETLCGMMYMYIHASVSRSPRGHGLVAPDKRHCRQWMSSLFCWFLPNPFIQDLFLWRTSQEFVKMDLYPLSLMSLLYAICSTGCRSIIGRCFGACQRSSCAEERRPQ